MTRVVLCLLFAVLVSPVARGLGGYDSFGHFWADEEQLTLLDFQWVDVSESGTKILRHDGGDNAVLKLNPPLVLYGNSYPSVSVSVNGYISSDDTDPGTDETNNCPFPGEVSSGGGARIAVLHDNLEIPDEDGGIYHQYFASSPHSWRQCGVHVIQWENVRHVGSSGTFDFQVLLFDNFDMVMQYGPGNGEEGSGSSTGIQNLAASLGEISEIGLKVACDFAGGIPENYVLAIQPPRELVLTLDDPPAGTVQAGTLRQILSSAKDGTRIEFDESLDGERFDMSLDKGGSGRMLLLEGRVLAFDATRGEEGVILRGLKDSETSETTSIRVTEGSDVRFENFALKPHPNDALRYTITGVGDEQEVDENHLTLNRCSIDPAELFPVVCNATNFQMNNSTIHGGGIILLNGVTSGSTLFHCGIWGSSISGSPDPALESEGGYRLDLYQAALNLNLNDAIKMVGHTDLVMKESEMILNTGRGIEANLEQGGFVDIENSQIRSNVPLTTSQGGGIRCLGDGVLTIERSTISGNRISEAGGAKNRGGGIYVDTTTALTVKESTISRNSAEDGGAIYCSVGDGEARTHVIASSTIEGNEATDGVVIRFASSDTEMEVSTLTGNEGNHLFQVRDGADLTFRTNTVHDNEVGRYFSIEPGGELELAENILSLGDASLFIGGGVINSSGYNLSDQSPAKLDDENDLLGMDPMLGTFGNHGGPTETFDLLPGSPAIDAGKPSNFTAFSDQRGQSRFVDGDLNGMTTPDIGSVEFQGQVVVTTTVDETLDPGAGVSLREALAIVSPGGIVTFEEGFGGRVIALNSSLIITDDVTIDASSLQSSVTLSGREDYRPIQVNGASVVLNHLTLLNGNGNGDPGGGLQVLGGDVTLEDCDVRKCRTGGSGGGIYVDGNSTLQMRRGLISGNEITAAGGGLGGAIYGASGSQMKFVQCDIRGNSTLSLGSGGAIAFEGGAPEALEITRCSIVRNTCGVNGGGIYLSGADSCVILNSTISGNVSLSGKGGGIYAEEESSGTLLFSTLADNACEDGAGGIHLDGDSEFSSNHSILAANRNANGLLNAKKLNRVTSLGHNLCDDDSLMGGLLARGDLLNRAAHLGPLANYGNDVLVHTLLENSPAIDAGNLQVQAPPGLDQRGRIRIADGDRDGTARIDIGAFEAGRPLIVDTLVDEQIDNGEISLREALNQASDGGRVIFEESLSGGQVDLNAQLGALALGRSVQVDATGLSGGLKINGGDVVRCLDISNGRAVALHGLVIKNGDAEGSGGGIKSDGDLVLSYCSLSGNQADAGGGAVACSGGELFAWNCTFYNNSADVSGGAVRLVLEARGKFEHCTFSDNMSQADEGTFGVDGNQMSFYSSIIDGDGVLFHNAGAALALDLIESKGYNLIEQLGAALVIGFDQETDQQTGDSVLASVSQTGGWGVVLTPSAGGGARDGGDPGVSLLSAFDVRGFLRVEGGVIDIGSAEFGGKTQDSDSDDIPDWWEKLHGLDPDDGSDAAGDLDADALSNLEEYNGGTNPRVSDAVVAETVPQILSVELGAQVPESLEIVFASDPGVTYSIESSQNLDDGFTPFDTVTGAAGSGQTAVIVAGFSGRHFFRIIR